MIPIAKPRRIPKVLFRLFRSLRKPRLHLFPVGEADAHRNHIFRQGGRGVQGPNLFATKNSFRWTVIENPIPKNPTQIIGSPKMVLDFLLSMAFPMSPLSPWCFPAQNPKPLSLQRLQAPTPDGVPTSSNQVIWRLPAVAPSSGSPGFSTFWRKLTLWYVEDAKRSCSIKHSTVYYNILIHFIIISIWVSYAKCWVKTVFILSMTQSLWISTAHVLWAGLIIQIIRLVRGDLGAKLRSSGTACASVNHGMFKLRISETPLNPGMMSIKVRSSNPIGLR